MLTNEGSMVENVNYDPVLGKSDHLTKTFVYTCFMSTDPDATFVIWNYFKWDYEAINESLEKCIGETLSMVRLGPIMVILC